MDRPPVKLLSLLMLLSLLSGCHRPSVKGPSIDSALVEQLQQFGPWLDTDADALIVADISAIAKSADAAPWIELLRRSPYNAGIGPADLVAIAGVKLAAFSAQFPELPEEPRRYFLLQTATDPNTILPRIADAAQLAGTPLQTTQDTEGVRLVDPTGALAIGKLNEHVVIGGDVAGLEHARRHAMEGLHPPSKKILTELLAGNPPVSKNTIAWGRVRMTSSMYRLFPPSWQTITEMRFVIEDRVSMSLTATMRFIDAPKAAAFAETLKGLFTLGAINIHDTPWLTPLLGSTIVRPESTTLQITMSLPPELAMQMPTSGCHLTSQLHWHSHDIGLFSLLIVLGGLWLWRRHRCK